MINLAWIDGAVCDLAEAKVPLEDRGYLFGDGVYEFIRIYNRKPFHLAEHLERLNRSAGAIGIAVPYPPAEVENTITGLIEDSDCVDGYVYLQVTRGSARRDHLLPAGTKPSLVMYTREYVSPASIDEINPAACITLPDERWLNCHIKSINLLPNVLGKHQAAGAGAQEAIFFRPGGIVTEGTRTNVFAVIEGMIRTHPESPMILSGITRAIVLELADKLKIPVSEEAFRVEELEKASEVWITSSGVEIQPVDAIDGRPVNGKVPGSICRLLIEEFWKKVEEECYDGRKRSA